jgi:hypothetical protein
MQFLIFCFLFYLEKRENNNYLETIHMQKIERDHPKKQFRLFRDRKHLLH